MNLFRLVTFGRLRSFRSRLLLLAALTGAVAAGLVCAALVTTQQVRTRNLVEEHLQNKGLVIAYNVAATLGFDQPDEAAEALESLRVVNYLAAAYVYDAQGKLFVRQHLAGAADLQDLPHVPPMPQGLYEHGHWLVYHSPITVGDTYLGTLVLYYDHSWLKRRMWINIATAFLITAVSTAVAMLIALRLQGALAGPIREIIATSRVVSESGDYSARAKQFDEDELGELTKAFNAMLARIEHQASELRDREHRLTTLTNAVPAFVWSADAEGHLLDINDQWYEYTGTTRGPTLDDLVGKHVHYDDTEETTRRWQEAASRGDSFEAELRIRRHDGQYRWFLARAEPLRNQDGNIIGWFGTSTDIQDRKQAEAERDQLLESERAARTEAEHASRMKDEFVATLSHELRTPLTAILGWAQMLKRRDSQDSLVAEGLETIERNARAQTQIIEDLLDMSRIVSGKIRLDVQLIELADVIDAALSTVQPAAESKGIRLQKIIDPRVSPVHGDASRLQQIVWNLLSNAVKFTPKGGRVQIALQRINSHIEINVSDTGEGIAPDFLPYLFERFRQADASTTRPHAGLGIGLALVKHLTELHGGTVSASSPGKEQGSTFTVKLPLAIMHPRADEPQRVHPTRSATHRVGETVKLDGVRVLVVEDERDARTFIERLLEAADADVFGTGSGSEALDCVQSFHPDVIVSDIGMPLMDGYQFIRELRKRPPNEGGRTPAVALTAFARSEDRTRALIAGYQMHVAKPVEPAELLATVASLASLIPHDGPQN